MLHKKGHDVLFGFKLVHYIGTPRTPGPRQTLKPCEFPDAAPAVGVRSSRENSALRLHFDICPDA